MSESENGKESGRPDRRLSQGRGIFLSTGLALLFGVTEALVLQQLHFWLEYSSEKGDTEQKFIDGRWWVYNSYADWTRHENLPFRTAPAVKKVLRGLETDGVIVSAQFGGTDRKKWYTIDYDALIEHAQEHWNPAHGDLDEMLALQVPAWWNDYTQNFLSHASDKKYPMDETKNIPCNGEKVSDAPDNNYPLIPDSSSDSSSDLSSDDSRADGEDAAPPHPPPLTAGLSPPDPEDQTAAPDAGDSSPRAAPDGDATQPHGAHEVQPKRKQRARTAQDDMFDAVAWVLFKADTPDDIALLSKGARANTGRTAKRLRDYGATVDDLRAWWGWWCGHDWRGRQGQHPTPSQLTDSWPQFEDWRANPTPAPTGHAKARASPGARGFGSNGQPAGDGEYPVEKRKEQHIVIPESARTS